jgi:hypothetical protein
VLPFDIEAAITYAEIFAATGSRCSVWRGPTLRAECSISSPSRIFSQSAERGGFIIGVKNVNSTFPFSPMRQRKRCDLPVSFRSK